MVADLRAEQALRVAKRPFHRLEQLEHGDLIRRLSQLEPAMRTTRRSSNPRFDQLLHHFRQMMLRNMKRSGDLLVGETAAWTPRQESRSMQR